MYDTGICLYIDDPLDEMCMWDNMYEVFYESFELLADDSGFYITDNDYSEIITKFYNKQIFYFFKNLQKYYSIFGCRKGIHYTKLYLTAQSNFMRNVYNCDYYMIYNYKHNAYAGIKFIFFDYFDYYSDFIENLIVLISFFKNANAEMRKEIYSYQKQKYSEKPERTKRQGVDSYATAS